MLDVIIVGAGIAGLSAAVSLRRAGHRVQIYERSSLNDEVGAAINVPPNASRPLLAWGLDPNAGRFVRAQGVVMGVGATKEQVSFTPIGNWVDGVYGAPFYFAHRVDLHDALKLLATGKKGLGEPVIVHLKRRITGYDPDAPSITLSSGEVIKGDVVIAADGIHSIAVETILGQPNPPQPQEIYNACFRFLIPAADLEADCATRWWNRDREGIMSIYMNGKVGNRLVSYPCRNNEVWNFVAMFHSEQLTAATKEDWHAPVDKSDLLSAFEDFHPDLRAVLSKATEVKRWPLLYRAPVSTWTKGRMVILGDAAHPMLPHQGQGGAQGIEDGIALGISLCGITPGDVQERLRLFEKIRKARASTIQVLSNAGHEQMELIYKEVEKYIDVVPKTQLEFAQFNWGHDVVGWSVKHVRELDSTFELPVGFFHGRTSVPEPQGQKKEGLEDAP